MLFANKRTAYLLTCDETSERAISCKNVLERVGFSPIIIVTAIPHENKVLSNKLSMQHMCQMIIDSEDENWQYIFEDDIDTVASITIDDIVKYEDYSNKLIYLGCCLYSTKNIYVGHTKKWSKNESEDNTPLHVTDLNLHQYKIILSKQQFLFDKKKIIFGSNGNDPILIHSLHNTVDCKCDKTGSYQNTNVYCDNSHLLYYVNKFCRGAHAFGLNKTSAKELLDLSNRLTDPAKKYHYMDVIIEEYVKDYPAPIVRFDLEGCCPGHRGVFYQNRIKYPSTIH